MSKITDQLKWKGLVIQTTFFGREYIREEDFDLAFNLAYTMGANAGAKQTYEIFRPLKWEKEG